MTAPSPKRSKLLARDPCGICADEYAIGDERHLRCCGETCCVQCVRKWILQKDVPECVLCRKPMNRMYMIETCNEWWVKGEFRDHELEVITKNQSQPDDAIRRGVRALQDLGNIEKALQAFQERRKKEQNALDEARGKLQKTQNIILDLKACLNAGRGMVQAPATAGQSERFHEASEAARAFNAKNDLEDTAGLLRAARQAVRRGESSADDPAGPEDESFPCPHTGCIGKAVARNNRIAACNVCNRVACAQCREIPSGEEHKCDPAVLESIKTMKKSSTPCPTCNVSIQRSEGCRQMYCTQCGTFFDYHTGKPISRFEFRHNPHYLEQQGHRGVDVGCGQRIHIPSITDFLKEGMGAPGRRAFIRWVQAINERMELYEKYPIRNTHNPFQKIKCDFHAKKIDKGAFAKKIRNKQNAEARRIEWGLCVRLLYDSMRDILTRLGRGNIPGIAKEIQAIVGIARDRAKKIQSVLQCQIPHDFDMAMRKLESSFQALEPSAED